MDWIHAKNYGLLSQPDRMKVEVLIKIAEQLERLNKNLEASEMKVRVSGLVSTHQG